MLKNYLVVALRSLRRQKGYAFINVFGLAVGIAVCLLAGLFVRSELSFDRFHEKSERIVRPWVHEEYGPDEQFTNTVTPLPLGPTLAAEVPEVEAFTRTLPFTVTVVRGAEAANESALLVDPAFFDLFSFPLVSGSADPLARHDAVVLTETTAQRYFGEADPVGQALTLRLDDAERTFTVAAVAADPPTTSSVQFGALLPFSQVDGVVSERQLQSWFNVSAETYVLLRDGATPAEVEATLPPVIATALGPDFEGTYTVGLQPIRDIHLNPDLPTGIAAVSDPRYAVTLGVIALLVLLIACINFTTLAVGRSVERTREVGVRKAMGAHRSQLMGQFWGEAALMTGLALVAGFSLAVMALPTFNDIAGRTLSLRPDAGLVLAALALTGIVALVAGSYPAVVLSRSRPAEVLRGRLGLGTRSGVQRGLVALQFALSIGLLAGTLVIAQQLRYLQSTNLGYAADRVVALPNASDFRAGLEPLAPLLGALGQESAVSAVSAGAFSFGDPAWAEGGFTDAADRYRTFRFNAVAPDFLTTMQIALLEGTGFAPAPALAAQQVVVNQAFAEAFDGVVVGQPLPEPFAAYTVAGVTEDFHYASLHTAVEPLLLVTEAQPLFQGLENVGFATSPDLDVLVRLGPGPLPAAMAALERVWTATAPDRPFDYVFLDDALDQQYRAEERLGRIVGIASGLAVLIACLGLFGLAALVATQRRKEIGVRKVLGASVPDLVLLLSKDLATLVGVAFVVAAPLAYVLVGQWLDDFAYRIEVGPGAFALAGGLALVVALLTITVHTLRAATADPVEALRTE
ncbi:MAG: ABC transporter permease [Rhodothermales bacterium]